MTAAGRIASRSLSQRATKRRAKSNRSVTVTAHCAWLQALGLVAIVIVAYLPALNAGYIWDDDLYVTENPVLRTIPGLIAIWLEPHATPQYYPLVHSSFWLEYHAWGLSPLGYHAVNILLHAANVLLLWKLLTRLRLPWAWFAAAVFAVHPVHVESVAWITERKNVLSTCLYLMAGLAWLRFWPVDAERPILSSRKWYLVALLAFFGALLSKTVTCSLPAAILLVRWWKHGRLSRRDWAWTAPMFSLGVAMAWVTATLEKAHVGAQGLEWNWPLVDRVLIAGRALWFYVAKLVFPARLTFIYPRWQIDSSAAWQYLFPLMAIVALVTLWSVRGRVGRGPLVAALFFAGTVSPALGFFAVYPMRYSFVADHFNYLSSIGLIVLAAATAATIANRIEGGTAPRSRCLAAVVVLTFVMLSSRQAHVYHDSETLWRDTVAKNDTSFLACNNLGCILAARGQIDDALPWFRRTAELNPRFQEGLNNLGGALLHIGQNRDAANVLRRSLEIEPRTMTAHYKLGIALCRLDEMEAGIDEFRRAMQLAPDFVAAPYSLGVELLRHDRHRQAIEPFEQFVRLDPDCADGWLLLGKAAWSCDRRDYAIDCLRSAAVADPMRDDIRKQLGSYLTLAGELPSLEERLTTASKPSATGGPPSPQSPPVRR